MKPPARPTRLHRSPRTPPRVRPLAALCAVLAGATLALLPAPGTGWSQAASSAGPPWADPEALRVTVDEDGPIAVPVQGLIDAGWSLDQTHADEIALTEDGAHRPLWIEDDGDGRLSAADTLLFYGQAMTGEFTRERVYWLQRARRPESQVRASDTITGPIVARPYTATLRWEQDSAYVASQPAAEGPDRWMWGAALTAPATRTLQLTLPHNAQAQATGRLTVTLQGYTDDPRQVGDHHLLLRWDGTTIADRILEGRGVHEIAASTSGLPLTPGEHSLEIISLGDTGAAVDSMFLNRVSLELGARTDLGGGRLHFRPPHDARAGEIVDYALRGTTGAETLRVWDIGDPKHPVEISGITIGQGADGAPVHRFADRAEAGRRYVAFQPSAARPPARIEGHLASNWHEPEAGADWIAITHAEFKPEVERLSAFRRAQGWRTAVVDVADVYDEFSGGVYDPSAIRAFVAHAWRTWPRPAPRFLLLVGSATLDHRGGYRPPTRQFVPAPRVEIAPGGQLATVTSDTWYALLEGDDPVPELGVGRLPVSNAREARSVVDKIIGYETRTTSESPQDWRRRTIWVADDGASGFEFFNTQLIEMLPPDHHARRFDAGRYDRDRDLSADLRAAVEDGALALHFTGHGNVDLWSPWPGGGTIFANGDIAQLRNRDALPLLTSATCMNGFIDNPVKPISMAEQWLLQSGGGGIAAWAPSGFTSLSIQDVLLGTLYSGLHDGRQRPVGDLTREASRAAWAAWPSGGDIIRMFVFVGDPATVIASDSRARLDVPLFLPLLHAGSPIQATQSP